MFPSQTLQGMCRGTPSSVSVPGAEEKKQEEEPVAPTVHNAEDPGAGDLCPESDYDSTGDKILGPGEIVWPKYGRIFCPAQIVSHCNNIKSAAEV